MDTRTRAQRRFIMQSVKTRDTGPELSVRKVLTALGYRYRLHRRDLPGSPDIVFPGRKTVLFVHGCYWHGHRCSKGKLPKSGLDYWGPKIAANRERDRRNSAALRKLGWTVSVVWQCETREPDKLAVQLRRFLGMAKNRVVGKTETIVQKKNILLGSPALVRNRG